ncbi:MAG: hypothetical protein ACW99A_24110 [Candidatus Kariarchaeaceae archaeon]
MKSENISNTHISIFYLTLIAFHSIMILFVLDRDMDLPLGLLFYVIIIGFTIIGFFYVDLHDQSSIDNKYRKYAINSSFVIIYSMFYSYLLFIITAYYLFSQHSKFQRD